MNEEDRRCKNCIYLGDCDRGSDYTLDAENYCCDDFTADPDRFSNLQRTETEIT